MILYICLILIVKISMAISEMPTFKNQMRVKHESSELASQLL